MSDLVLRDRRVGAIRKMVVHDGHPGPVKIGVEPEFLEWLTDPARNGGGAHHGLRLLRGRPDDLADAGRAAGRP